LKKTRTQIFAKWCVLERPISLHKITQVKVIMLDTTEKTGLLKSRKRDTLVSQHGNKPEASNQQLYVSFANEMSIEDTRDEDKKLILTSNSEVINWLNDKITSVIKFNKELKSFAEIF
jgi:hypothetical protein